ncbi:hypothetical protein G9A89_017528 [Geosiphon pyriformis]|nr:hypothetical protein G9A89_017528 [Geosiphon pyriformis]
MSIAQEIIAHHLGIIILQRTSTNNNHPKVAESEIIGTNHLEFAKFLFQQYSQQLGLTNNYYPVESAFNFYINKKITNFFGRPTNPNSDIINQLYLPLIIKINLPPIPPITEQQQQPQSLLQQQNDNRALQAIPYFLQDTTNSWYQSLTAKPQIKKLKQLLFTWDTSTETCAKFKQSKLTPQILNQFIHSLHITWARDFESVKLKANYAQAINLVINRSSNLDSKLKQLSNSINQKLEGYLANNSNLLTTSILSSNLSANNTCHLSVTATSNISIPTNSNTATKLILKQNPKAKTDTTELEISNGSPSTNLQFFKPVIRILTIEFKNWVLSKPEFPELFKSSKLKQKQPLTNNILPATITEDESLTAIFSFELKEPVETLLFSGATLESKLITAMYTDAKVDGQHIKLILNSGSAGNQLGCRIDHAASARIITTNGTTKTPIGKIDDFSFDYNLH